MNLLTVKNISFAYRSSKTNFLKDINFSVKQGEYIVILGANGSGKSTLARVLEQKIKNESNNLLEEKITGKIQGRVEFEKNKTFAFAFSDDNFSDLKNIKDEIRSRLKKLSLTDSEIEQRTIESLAATGLIDESNSVAKNLSSSQKQKLTLSAVFAQQADLLLIDDTLSMLDPKSRSEILDYLDFYNSTGKTIIHITHNFDDIEKAHRVIFLQKGKICFDGTLQDFKEKNELSKNFFAEPIPRSPYIFCSDFAQNDKNSLPKVCFLAENLSFSYGKKEVLKNLNLKLFSGSLTALTGICASGKSTFLKIAEGFIQPNSGTIFAISKPKVLTQNSTDTKENLTFLSAGERLKLCIEEFCSSKENILFFDEILAGLDQKNRLLILKKLRELAFSGKAVLFTTSRMDEASFADRHISLQDGAVANDTLNPTLEYDTNIKNLFQISRKSGENSNE